MGKLLFTHISNKTGKTYILHARPQTLKGNRETVLYYFALKAGEHAASSLPDGYEVTENIKTGLPLLKKSGKVQGAPWKETDLGNY